MGLTYSPSKRHKLSSAYVTKEVSTDQFIMDQFGSDQTDVTCFSGSNMDVSKFTFENSS